MTRKRKAPEPPADADFSPSTAPLSACWWMQRFVDHFVADATTKIERGDPHARVAIECLFVGAISHACRLTEAQSDGLLAIIHGKTAAEWAASIEAAKKLDE
jgi:hypothetical protein